MATPRRRGHGSCLMGAALAEALGRRRRRLSWLYYHRRDSAWHPCGRKRGGLEPPSGEAP